MTAALPWFPVCQHLHLLLHPEAWAGDLRGILYTDIFLLVAHAVEGTTLRTPHNGH